MDTHICVYMYKHKVKRHYLEIWSGYLHWKYIKLSVYFLPSLHIYTQTFLSMYTAEDFLHMEQKLCVVKHAGKPPGFLHL